jgi:riboflavin biosynthesis pyrimidine reductase
VAADVARVGSALEDPDPRVKGQGHARLKAAGIAVEVGEGAAQAAEINAGFLLRVTEGRPLFHLKLASSLDGRIATASGESKWITGGAARALGERGLTRVLVEGGGEVAAAFLKAGLVDRISSYRAGLVLGGDGRSAVGELGFNRLDFAPRFNLLSTRSLAGDTLETWARRT